MKKRLLAAIMSLCMIVSLLPVSALAYGGHGDYPGGGSYEKKYDVYLEFDGNNVPDEGETVTVTVNGQHKDGKVHKDGIFYHTYYVLVDDLVSGSNQSHLTATVTNNDGYSGTAKLRWDDGGWLGEDRYEGIVNDWNKPQQPGGDETQDGEDAYFYVLEPNYNGTLANADKGDFYYVGKGSVENGDPAFDVDGIV